MLVVDLAGECLGMLVRAMLWLISEFVGELLIRGTGRLVVRLVWREEPSESQEWLYGCLAWIVMFALLAWLL